MTNENPLQRKDTSIVQVPIDVVQSFDAYRLGWTSDKIALDFGRKEDDSYNVIARYEMDREAFHNFIEMILESLSLMQQEGHGYDDIDIIKQETPEKEDK